MKYKKKIKDLKQRIDLMEFFKVPLGGVKEDGEDFFYTIEVDDLDNPISLEDDWKWIEDVAILFTFEKEVKKFVEGKTIEQYNINKLQEFLGLDNITSMEILEPSNPYDM